MLKVGLTGSIAVGKSFVCSILSANGCEVLDADMVAKQLVRPGEKGLDLIIAEFGEAILDADRALDRKKLGEIVFSDREKRELLNSLLHPLIMEVQDEWLTKRAKAEPGGIAIVDAALMIETGSYRRYDAIIVVWCDREIQIERLMKRDKLARAEAKRRIDTQMSQDQKKQYADFLIATSGGFKAARRETLDVLSGLRELAS